VAIVCAMQHKPSLYILDEPTSGLDPLMQKEFFEILKERHSDGATIFLSSHVLSEIQKNCVRAAIIKNGTVVALDKVENLSKTGAKRITLHGVTSIPETLVVQSVEVGEDYITFLYCDEIKRLLTTAANMPITDITIVEPDLDEIFMYYYEKDGKNE
ncbi:MAG: AAA family ATPase, partial [Lachnospiraceae bacterium]|nr:AAA family ATPase [Lachnospiraceae bacterium]